MSIASFDPDSGARANTCILITPPADPVVTLAEAREHLRIDATGSPPSHPEDASIALFVASATAEVDGWEGEIGRALMIQTWEYQAPYFSVDPEGMAIPLPPLRSVISVKYLDAAGVEQTLSPSAYRVVPATSKPGVILSVGGWPQTAVGPDAVRIRFEAGYDDADAVPPPVKMWIRQRMAQFFDNREAIIVGTIVNTLPGMDSLLDKLRVRRVFL